MTLKEILQRLKEIEKELRAEGADLTALETEITELTEKRDALISSEEKRKALLENIANNNYTLEVRNFETIKEDEVKGYDSTEYRSAFFKKMLGLEMSEAEERAYTHTTANTGAVLPKETVDKIFSNMAEQHPLLADINVLRTGTVIAIVKHTAIAEGDASVVNEGVANADEKNTFVNVTLSGKDIAKSVKYSYRLQAMAIPAFEAYLVKEIGDRISSAWAKQVVAKIKSDLHAENKPNALTKPLVITDILNALAKLKGVTGQVVVYANSAGIYSKIAQIKDADTKVSFIPDYSQSVAGTLLGKPIKQEDALADNEILIIDPSQYTENVVQDITIESDRDIEKHVHILSGIMIAEGTMTNDKGGFMITTQA